MEKDNMKENETMNDKEEVEVETPKDENIEDVSNSSEEVNDTTKEAEALISEEDNARLSTAGSILANILDQLLIVAFSSLLVFLCDSILRLFGYMFVKDNGSIILAGGIIYFIISCIYAPIMEKTKLRNTIARKILSV